MVARSINFWVHARTLRDDPPETWFRVKTRCSNEEFDDFAETAFIREAENWLCKSGLRGKYAWVTTAYATGDNDEPEDSVTFAFSNEQTAIMFKLRFG